MSDIIIDYDIDFVLGEGCIDLEIDENSYIRAYISLDFDTSCEWCWDGVREYEECTPVAILCNANAHIRHITNSDDIEGEDCDLDSKDEQVIQDLIDSEYEAYLESLNSI